MDAVQVRGDLVMDEARRHQGACGGEGGISHRCLSLYAVHCTGPRTPDGGVNDVSDL